MSTEQTTTPDIVYLIREVLEVYNDETIHPTLAEAFALAIEANFDVDLSAFTELLYTDEPVSDDCDECLGLRFAYDPDVISAADAEAAARRAIRKMMEGK